MVDEAELCSSVRSAFEVWVVQCEVGHCRGESGLSVDQCQLHVLQLAVRLMDLLSTLLMCNGFPGIQKAVVDQTTADHQTVTMTFFWCKLGFGKCCGTSWSNKKLDLSKVISQKT